jgi:hypothetical protein
MKGPPTEHINTLALDLVWPTQHQRYWLGTAGSPPFDIPRDGALFAADGKKHSVYPTFDAFANAMVLRSTAVLLHLTPITDMATPVRDAFFAKATPMPDEPQWPYAHTLDVAADEVYICASDENFYRVDTFTLSGLLKWEQLPVTYSVLEKVPTGEAFAGAVVAPSYEEGRMWALVFPAAGREMSMRRVELEKRHVNSIRNLKIATDHN